MVINTNVEAQRTANNLNVSQSNLAKSLSRLSSGSRIVNPSDDAAGLAVSSRLRAQIKRLDSALSNVVNAVSFTQTQDGFMKTIDKAFRRMGELSMLARDETKSADDRALYDQEFQQLMDYVNDTKSKEFNSVSLFDGADIAVTIDAEGDVFEMDGIEMTGKKYTNALDNLGPLTAATGANTGDVITMPGHGFEDGDPAYVDGNWTDLDEFEADGTTRKKYVVEVIDANTFQVHPVGTKYDEDTDSFIAAGGGASTIVPLTADDAAGSIYKYSERVHIKTATAADDALSKVKVAISQVAQDRAALGAVQSRLNFTNEQLSVTKENLSSAISRIADVDVAEEATQYARYQILVQSGTQMLTQANNLPNAALQLLRG